jgi:hypothetical protein
MESYINDLNSNCWIKVTDLQIIDCSDAKSFRIKNSTCENCEKSKDYTIANSGPVVRFRSDNIVVWDFKKLSIRELIIWLLSNSSKNSIFYLPLDLHIYCFIPSTSRGK